MALLRKVARRPRTAVVVGFGRTFAPTNSAASESDRPSIRPQKAAWQTAPVDRHFENQEFSISERGGNGARHAAMQLWRGASSRTRDHASPQLGGASGRRLPAATRPSVPRCAFRLAHTLPPPRPIGKLKQPADWRPRTEALWAGELRREDRFNPARRLFPGGNCSFRME